MDCDSHVYNRNQFSERVRNLYKEVHATDIQKDQNNGPVCTPDGEKS